MIQGWSDGIFLKKINLVHKKRYRLYHPSASRIKEFDVKAWSSFFKFCFVRNPYEKAVSDYIWRVRSRGIDLSFCDFLKKIADPGIQDKERVVPSCPDNWPMYTINDEIVADFVGRYENFASDFKEICGCIGIPFKEGNIPRIKHIRDYRYQDYYGEKEKKLVANIYHKEIEHFGYSFS